jgi:hypothetical protein
MTNEEAKKAAIIAAFGDKWNFFTEEYKQHLLSRKHWVDMSIKYGAMNTPNYYKSPTPQRLGFAGVIEEKCEFWRPIELKGIENNNGWIRIEPDGSNLPSDGTYKWLFESGNSSIFDYKKGDTLSIKLTHYRPIEIELKPVY